MHSGAILQGKGNEGSACAIPAGRLKAARPPDAEEETEERVPCHHS
jgi:hypothetical protein